MFFLDTNIVIACLRGRSPAAMRHLLAHPAGEIRIPLQVRAELHLGAARSANPVQSALRVDQFLQPFSIAWPDENTLQNYVQIRTHLETAGTPISEPDLWIAATARAAAGIVVTANTGEFTRVPGLVVENWLND